LKRRDFLKGAVVGSAGLIGSSLLPRSGEAQNLVKVRQRMKFPKIDSFSHFVPIDFVTHLQQLGGPPNSLLAIANAIPEHSNVDARLKMMDDTKIDLSIIFPQPDLEGGLGPVFMTPGKALDAAQFLNNEISGICAANSTRFKFCALLPMNSLADMQTEFDRAMTLPGMVGVGINTGPLTTPPEDALHMAVYAKAVQYDVPVWIHLNRGATYPDYVTDPVQPTPPFPPNTRISYDYSWVNFGFLMDGSAAMMRIVIADVFKKNPDIKLIVHQRGHLIPLYKDRIKMHFQTFQGIFGAPVGMPANFDVDYTMEQFKQFYVDAICSGDDTDLLTRSVNFFGLDHVMYATDAAYSPNGGRYTAGMTRDSVLGLRVRNNDLKDIFANNMRNLIPDKVWER
jgi:predicted TIM-barrel fold metal-dependent hydrolase